MRRPGDTAISAWRDEQSRVDLRAHAKAYIRKGWPVVPLWWPEFALVCACPQKGNCKSPGKHPMAKGWAEKPLTTGLDVDYWWANNPHANVGIATGAASGLVVMDIDPDHGGWESYSRIVKKHGKLPETLVSVTGSGGRHVLFRHPGEQVKNAVRCLPGIDIRGDGGQIVAPPSLHGSGDRYRWHPDGHPATAGLAEMPSWLFTMLEIKRQRRRERNRRRGESKYGRVLDPSNLPAIVEGYRNEELCSIVGRLIWENREESEIREMTHQINRARCVPPLSDKEVDGLVSSAVRRWAT